MRKNIWMAAFFALVLGLSATASYAACRPGCSCTDPAAPGGAGGGGSNPENSSGTQGGIMGQLERRADAKRLENKALTRQHVKMNDNGPGMTCFDHALALTQQLGDIFSDVGPGFVPPRSADIFIGGSSFPDMGLSNWLGGGLNDVVSPGLISHVANFGDSLSAALGATIAGYLDTFADGILGPLTDAFSAVSGPIDQINTAMASINGWYSTISSILEALGGQMPSYIIGIVATVNGLWTMIQDMISTALSAAMSAITSIISSIQSAIDAAIANVTNMFSNIGEGGCARIANLWQGDLTLSLPAPFEEFRGLVGQALEQGAPYFTLYQMLTGATGGGVDFLGELGNAANSDIISRALGDITIMSGPGSIPSWPSVPAFPPVGTSTTDIISAM